jgi:hypothetical protein
MGMKKFLLFAIFLVSLSFLISNAKAHWWNSTWEYRREIMINNTQNPNNLIDYQVAINLTYSPNMQPDFSDIRFTWYNSTSGTETEIPYWIESKVNSQWAYVWVKVPNIPASSTATIYLYYGNTTPVSSASNTTATFIREIDGAQPVKASWRLDEGSGTTAYDSSGNNNNGNLVNSPTWVDGKFGKALSFNTSNYVSTNLDVQPSAMPNTSWEAWFYPTESNYYTGHILSSDDGGFDRFIRVAYVNNFSIGAGGREWVPPTNFNPNQWYHIVVIWTTDNIYFYKNSVKYTYGAAPGSQSTTRKLSIGANPVGAEGFKGKVDEVRIYNRVLSDEEISDLYNNYGYTTTNYPGRVLVRKYSAPEPTYSIGAEEVSLSMTISDVSEVKSFQPTEFIKVNGTNLMLGGQPYRFVGMNSYYLVDYATNFTYDDDGNPIYNSRQYVLEVLNEMHYLNLNVLRTWGGMECGYANHNYSVWDCAPIGGHYNAFQKYTHGNWSEEMYQALDWLIYEAGKRDIRIALVLVNNWKEYGGMRWYVQQSPTTNKTWENITDETDSRFWEFHDQFYSDANCKQYFKDFINHTLWRNNTYTGRYYKDEPTIAMWILANEPRAKSQGNNYTLIRNWTKEMADYIRSIDTNHIIALGIEGWGDPWEGTNFIYNQNLGNLSIATYNINPYQWDWFAQRSEYATDLDWADEGWNTTKVIDWWTNNTSLSYNNRYETGYIPNYNPNLGRHGYKDWVRQHVDWANINLSKPILAMEVLYPLRKGKVAIDGDKATYDLRVKFFNQTVKNFFDNGGDGLLFWVLQHDNYYWSTANSSYAGKMDDGFGFYVSDNATLSDSSKPVIDTLTWIRDSGYVNLLNDYKYNFNYKPIINGANPKNATLYLFINNENGTSYTIKITNTSEIKNGDLNTFTYQFRRVAGNSDKNFTYIIEVCSDNPDLGCMNTTQSNTIIILATKPAIVLNSPAEKRYPSLTQVFNYTVSADLDITYCQLFINGTANKTSTNIVKDTPQTFVVDFDKEGSYEWYIVCSDTQSNLGNSSKRNIIIGSPKWSDLQTSIYGTKININITWNDSLGYSIDTVLIENNFTGIAKNDTMVLIDAYINATEKKGVYNFNATLALGAYYYKIYANASDGVWNSTPTQIVFITQEITIFSPLNRSYYGGIDFTFKAIDGLDENFTVRTYLNNRLKYENLYYQNNTQTSYSKSLPTGTYNFTVYAEDSHGNSLQKEVIFTSLGYCGDNVCQADYENQANCFKDCGGVARQFTVGIGSVVLAFGGLMLLATAFASSPTEGKDYVFKIFMAAIGIILMVYGIIYLFNL